MTYFDDRTQGVLLPTSDNDAREKLMQLLGEMADVIDPTSGKDVQ
jgi:hypothetical protein